MTVTYRKGPLGYAVVSGGKPIGSIRDVRQHGGWLVSIEGFRPSTSSAFRGQHVFPSLSSAKAAVEHHLAQRSNVDGKTL